MTNTNWLKRAEDLSCKIRNFIDGKHQKIGGEGTVVKHSPRDGSFFYEFRDGDSQDVDNAVANAKIAFLDGRWSRVSVHQRKAVLYKLADLIEAHKEEFALLDCLDVGKPISVALGQDVPFAAATLRYYAEASDKIFDRAYTDGPAPNFSYQIRKPVGVVAGVIGWNFPLVLAATKLGPSLVMGNSLVLKPSEFTPLSVCLLAELAMEAGVPAGVLNTVNGKGGLVGAALAHHPDVNLLTFTGSSETGKEIMISAGQSNMKRLMLECGGKSPYIVFDDGPDDLDFIAQDVVDTAFPNQGELCAAGTRLLVQDSIKDELIPKIIERVKKVTPQDPLDVDTTFGALINESHMNKVLGYIDSGKKEGAELLCGGRRAALDLPGYYVEPTVFDRVDAKHRIAREEIFGPVLSVFSFSDEEEAITIANDSSYGLAAYVCTENLGRAQRMAQRLEAGSIVIVGSATLSGGGVEMGVEGHKGSGFGIEGGLGGLASYTISSSVRVFT